MRPHADTRTRNSGTWRRLLVLLALAFASAIAAPAWLLASDGSHAEESLQQRDHRLIAETLQAMPPQRPGQPDLYVLGFAGDGEENVFRNEVLYLERLMNARFGADGRVITLVNHPDSLDEDTPRPLASLDNLRHALAGIGAAMDTEEDLLLLFITTHGSEDHWLSVQLAPFLTDQTDAIAPDELAAALDDAGIRHRVAVVSACFSGGFLSSLRNPDSLVITAARKDRSSFGCGAQSSITYFGQAWLVDGLNRHDGFVAAFHDARKQIESRERKQGFKPSLPQMAPGEQIESLLARWRETLEPGPAVPYDTP